MPEGKGLVEYTLEYSYEKVLDAMADGFLIIHNESGEILYRNSRWEKMFPQFLDASQWYDILPKSFLEDLEAENSFYEKIDSEVYFFKPLKLGNKLGVLVEKSSFRDIEKNGNNIDTTGIISKEVQSLFSSCSDEDFVICDGSGVIEFAGESCARISNMPRGYFLGKNVYDLEREGFFTPSVSVLVLESKEPQVTIQTTKDNIQVVAIGIPMFNAAGGIEKIVSINTKYSVYNEKVKTVAQLQENPENEPSMPENEGDFDIITISESFLSIKRMLKMIAGVNSTVLITGETGSGKERVARYLHHISDRRDKPFVPVNCGSIPDNLLESELFGYEAGAFTGAVREGRKGLIEAANGGILFLDEIGELPLNQQVKILRVLQGKSLTRVGGVEEIPIDIRVIAATNSNLTGKIKSGEFREDLYYRINVIPIHVPPLRQRAEDIPILAKFFLKHYCKEQGVVKQFTSSAIEKMKEYSWPGNVRELDNVVEFLVVTNPKPYIDETDLPPEIFKGTVGEHSPSLFRFQEIIPLQEAVDAVERELIQMAMEKYESATKAAEALGVNQSTISRRLSKYGKNME